MSAVVVAQVIAPVASRREMKNFELAPEVSVVFPKAAGPMNLPVIVVPPFESTRIASPLSELAPPAPVAQTNAPEASSFVTKTSSESVVNVVVPKTGLAH